MYKIYLLGKAVTLCDSSRLSSPEDYDEIAACDPEIERTKLLQKLQNTKKLALISQDPASDFERLASQFVNINAAGGITFNKKGEVLMIYRNSKWDLPKGKCEHEEDIKECALREISEECGITGLKMGKPITETLHIYELKGEWVLKRTYWFEVQYEGSEKLVPQTEEGITDLKWVAREDLDVYLDKTYPTIVDVFREAGLTGR